MLDSVTHEAPYDVVLVHGAGGNNLLWKRTLQYLRGPSRAIAVNLPGHPSGEITCRTIEDYSEVLHQFIVESRVPRPVVCGHSMGSAVTLKLAIEHPEDVGGLVLVGAGAVFLNEYLACQDFDVRDELPRIAAKTLIVCGDRDQMTPPRWAHFLKANILNSELYFVRDSGHMLPLEKPEPLARLIQSFLESFSR